MKKEVLEDRLGVVLNRSWLVLVSCKNQVFEKRRRQEATWSDLEAIWAPKRLQNGHRGGSRKELRRVKMSRDELSEVELR